MTVINDSLKACEDCIQAIANDDYSAMTEARAIAVKQGVWETIRLSPETREQHSDARYLVVGESLGFESSRCDICYGLAGDRWQVTLMGSEVSK